MKIELEEVRVEMGSHQRIIVDKLFGSAIFVDLRIHCDVESGDWVIERGNPGPFVEVARIPAWLDSDSKDGGG